MTTRDSTSGKERQRARSRCATCASPAPSPPGLIIVTLAVGTLVAPMVGWTDWPSS